MILDPKTVKTPIKKNRGPEKTNNFLKKTVRESGFLSPKTKFGSPSSFLSPNRITRSQSNTDLFKPSFLETEKKTHQAKNSQISSSTILQKAEEIVEEFIHSDLKDVLDLSKCNLNDNEIEMYLSMARENKKIKGLKLISN